VSESLPENLLPDDALPNNAAEMPHTPYAPILETHLGQDHIDRIVQIFEEIGVTQWLEQNPLSQLHFTREVFSDFNTSVNGMYSFLTATLHVATQRDRATYGKTFEWGAVHSVSTTGVLQIDAVQRTLVHELGHHIHATLGKVDLESFNKTMRAVFLRGGTTYSKRDNIEYFAESFALYVFYPTELLVKDVDGYGMIEKALGVVGLEVEQK
jgi:hypothetical protein